MGKIEPRFITEAEASVQLEQLYNEHPEVVEAVEAMVEIASPRNARNPIRLLNEVLAVLGMEQLA